MPAWSPVEAVADTHDRRSWHRTRHPTDHVSDRSSEKDGAGGRGSLVIKERAVERIAGAAALQVPGVAPAAAEHQHGRRCTGTCVPSGGL